MLTFMVDFKSLVLIVIGVRVKTVQRILTCPRHSQLILLRLHTRITLHAQTAAQQQSNENIEARMSEKCGEWRD